MEELNLSVSITVEKKSSDAESEGARGTPGVLDLGD